MNLNGGLGWWNLKSNSNMNSCFSYGQICHALLPLLPIFASRLFLPTLRGLDVPDKPYLLLSDHYFGDPAEKRIHLTPEQSKLYQKGLQQHRQQIRLGL